MSIFILYIGKSQDTIDYFRSLLGSTIRFANDNAEAERILKDVDTALPLLFFYEKDNIKYDVPRIEYLKTHFPKAYIILITESLDKDEILKYQKAGVNDTSVPDISESRLRNGVEFVKSNQDIIASSSRQREPLGIYRCPYWKRIFDLLFSFLAIIFLSPLLLLTSLIILFESRGPVIYKSKRVGSNYTIFDFYKFRSMYKDADKRLKEYILLNQYQEAGSDDILIGDESISNIDGADSYEDNFYVSDDEVITESMFLRDKISRQKNNFVKYENDPRITRFGKIIRKYSIDELPQLFNIFKGDMSVVGNRPLPLYEAEQLTSDQYIDRFMGPSGLTGLWQVEKRGDSGKLSPEERKQLDVYYANNYNLWLDIKIIFKTLTAFVQKENV